jgi:2'-5' RNA ligase
MIAAETGRPLEVVAAIIAVLSPGMQWEANLRAARRLAKGESIKGTGGAYPVSVYKAMQALKTNDPMAALTGDLRKVMPFFQTLVSPKESAKKAVVDRHMFAIWYGDPAMGEASPPDAVYRQIQADVLAVGEAHGLSTQAVQAITWVLWRNRAKDTPERPSSEVAPTSWKTPMEERHREPTEEEWEAWQPPQMGVEEFASKEGALRGSMEEARLMHDQGYSDIALVGGGEPMYLRPGQADQLRMQYGEELQVMPLEDYVRMRPAEDLVEVGSHDLVARMRAEDEPGEKVGVFLRLPPEIAKQWSKEGRSGEDDSPPHFTVLFVGGVHEAEHDELMDVVERVASRFGPLPLALKEGVGWFENHKGQQIAHKELDDESEKRLGELHAALKEAVTGAGFEVKHKEPFIAHATLAYCDDRDYSGPIPEGSFTAHQLEVWGWPTDDVVALKKMDKAATADATWQVEIPLGIVVTAADLTAAKKRRRKEKRHRFAGEVYWLPKDETIARSRSRDAGADATEIRLDPGARVLSEGERDLIDMGAASLEDVMKMALEKGYDAVRVKDRLAIINQDAIAERTPASGRPGWHAG